MNNIKHQAENRNMSVVAYWIANLFTDMSSKPFPPRAYASAQAGHEMRDIPGSRSN